MNDLSEVSDLGETIIYLSNISVLSYRVISVNP